MRNKLLPHLVGPIVTFAVTVLIEGLSRFEWYTPSLALAFIGLPLSTLYGGLRSNLLSATIIVLYGLIEFHYDPARIIQTAIGAYGVAFVNGAGKRQLRQWILETERQRVKAEENQTKASLVDNLNGNIEILKEINRSLIDLAKAVAVMEKSDIERHVNLIQDKAANLAQRAIGWHQLAMETKHVKGEDPTKTQELKD